MKTFSRIIFIVLLLLSIPCPAQEKLKTVVLSERTGEVIDAAEKQRYHLFPQYHGFDSLRVLCSGRSAFFHRLYYSTPDGQKKDTLIACSRDEVLIAADIIQRYELLTSGKYKLGSRPVRIRIEGDSSGVSSLGEKILFGEALPFMGKTKPDFFESYPRFQGAITYMGGTLDASELESTLNDFEASFKNAGYSIPHHPDIETYYGLTSFSLQAILAKRMMLNVEAGLTDGQYYKLSFFAAEFEYAFIAEPGSSVMLSAGGGFASMNLQYSQKIMYNARISPIDTLGGYQKLESVSVSGSGMKDGGSLIVRFLFHPSEAKWLSLSAFARALYFPRYEVRTPKGGSIKIGINQFAAGLTLALQFSSY